MKTYLTTAIASVLFLATTAAHCEIPRIYNAYCYVATSENPHEGPVAVEFGKPEQEFFKRGNLSFRIFYGPDSGVQPYGENTLQLKVVNMDTNKQSSIVIGLNGTVPNRMDLVPNMDGFDGDFFCQKEKL